MGTTPRFFVAAGLSLRKLKLAATIAATIVNYIYGFLKQPFSKKGL